MSTRVRPPSLLSVAATARAALGAAVLRGKQATGLLRPLRAQPYLGHGTAVAVHVKGRVHEHTGVDAPRRSDSPLDNLLAMARRFTATPIPRARVLLRLADTEQEVVADADGYFRADLQPGAPLAAGWHDLDATLVSPLPDAAAGRTAGRTAGRVLVPAATAAFGVISDLDDTVIRTGIPTPLQAARTVLLNNAMTRTPFLGVAAFYRALQAGPSGADTNPLFYVSSSPWNLYDLVLSFLELQQVPAGPLFLRAWGLDADALPGGGHAGHKAELIRGLLATYPRLPFVLIGDSGQEDPEIYRDVVLAHPGRILAVYIRDVTTVARDAEVQVIAQQLRRGGVPCELVTDTAAAARHAVEHDLMVPAALAAVVSAVDSAVEGRAGR